MPQQRVAATLGISVEAVVARLEPEQRRSRQQAARLAVEQQGELLPHDEIITRYAQGATVAELGRLYGVHPSTIRRRIPDGLIRSRGRTPQHRPRTGAGQALVDEEVRRRDAAGESASALAREFGVSAHTIRARIPDADWLGRPAGKTPAPPPRPAQPRPGGVRMVLALPDEEILARYRAGQSATAMGREVGVDCRTVLRRIPEAERRGHLQAQRLNRPAPTSTRTRSAHCAPKVCPGRRSAPRWACRRRRSAPAHERHSSSASAVPRHGLHGAFPRLGYGARL
ncbi:hypothetical protein [Streptomyces sp. WAC08241]|uniref:hypothetical protein n=1 Tax=Streptomyces sp. WAC08241 TaxID=2487421 RepID=UPI000F7AEC99|nr:hypothetical protein [Streptomyces sp. WAC08241]RSS39049.1 hypothetical protein EF906_19670 [Streptomyces sp. WAC08241]